jgi:hypothetical protein
MCENCENYQSLVNNREFSDITLTVNDKTYFAHNVILSSQSSVFKEMFRSGIDDNVRINDLDCDVFEVFLNYVYTGRIKNEWKIDEFAEKLFLISNKYNVINLKEKFGKLIDINNDNVIKILIMADKTDATILRNCAIRYLSERLKDIINDSTYEWNELMKDYPKLVNVVLELTIEIKVV